MEKRLRGLFHSDELGSYNVVDRHGMERGMDTIANPNHKIVQPSKPGNRHQRGFANDKHPSFHSCPEQFGGNQDRQASNPISLRQPVDRQKFEGKQQSQRQEKNDDRRVGRQLTNRCLQPLHPTEDGDPRHEPSEPDPKSFLNPDQKGRENDQWGGEQPSPPTTFDRHRISLRSFCKSATAVPISFRCRSRSWAISRSIVSGPV